MEAAIHATSAVSGQASFALLGRRRPLSGSQEGRNAARHVRPLASPVGARRDRKVVAELDAAGMSRASEIMEELDRLQRNSFSQISGTTVSRTSMGTDGGQPAVFSAWQYQAPPFPPPPPPQQAPPDQQHQWEQQQQQQQQQWQQQQWQQQQWQQQQWQQQQQQQQPPAIWPSPTSPRTAAPPPPSFYPTQVPPSSAYPYAGYPPQAVPGTQQTPVLPMSSQYPAALPNGAFGGVTQPHFGGSGYAITTPPLGSSPTGGYYFGQLPLSLPPNGNFNQPAPNSFGQSLPNEFGQPAPSSFDQFPLMYGQSSPPQLTYPPAPNAQQVVPSAQQLEHEMATLRARLDQLAREQQQQREVAPGWLQGGALAPLNGSAAGAAGWPQAQGSALAGSSAAASAGSFSNGYAVPAAGFNAGYAGDSIPYGGLSARDYGYLLDGYNQAAVANSGAAPTAGFYAGANGNNAAAWAAPYATTPSPSQAWAAPPAQQGVHPGMPPQAPPRQQGNAPQPAQRGVPQPGVFSANPPAFSRQVVPQPPAASSQEAGVSWARPRSPALMNAAAGTSSPSSSAGTARPNSGGPPSAGPQGNTLADAAVKTEGLLQVLREMYGGTATGERDAAQASRGGGGSSNSSSGGFSGGELSAADARPRLSAEDILAKYRPVPGGQGFPGTSTTDGLSPSSFLGGDAPGNYNPGETTAATAPGMSASAAPPSPVAPSPVFPSFSPSSVATGVNKAAQGGPLAALFPGRVDGRAPEGGDGSSSEEGGSSIAASIMAAMQSVETSDVLARGTPLPSVRASGRGPRVLVSPSSVSPSSASLSASSSPAPGPAAALPSAAQAIAAAVAAATAPTPADRETVDIPPPVSSAVGMGPMTAGQTKVARASPSASAPTAAPTPAVAASRGGNAGIPPNPSEDKGPAPQVWRERRDGFTLLGRGGDGSLVPAVAGNVAADSVSEEKEYVAATGGVPGGSATASVTGPTMAEIIREREELAAKLAAVTKELEASQARNQEALRAAEEEVARARRKLAEERKSCFVNMRGLEEGKADAAKEAAAKEAALREVEEDLQRTRQKLAEDRKACFVNMRALEEEAAKIAAREVAAKEAELRELEEDLQRTRKKLAEDRKNCFVNMRALEEEKAAVAVAARAGVVASSGRGRGLQLVLPDVEDSSISDGVARSAGALSTSQLIQQLRALEVNTATMLTPEEALDLVKSRPPAAAPPLQKAAIAAQSTRQLQSVNSALRSEAAFLAAAAAENDQLRRKLDTAMRQLRSLEVASSTMLPAEEKDELLERIQALELAKSGMMTPEEKGELLQRMRSLEVASGSMMGPEEVEAIVREKDGLLGRLREMEVASSMMVAVDEVDAVVRQLRELEVAASGMVSCEEADGLLKQVRALEVAVSTMVSSEEKDEMLRKMRVLEVAASAMLTPEEAEEREKLLLAKVTASLESEHRRALSSATSLHQRAQDALARELRSLELEMSSMATMEELEAQLARVEADASSDAERAVREVTEASKREVAGAVAAARGQLEARDWMLVSADAAMGVLEARLAVVKREAEGKAAEAGEARARAEQLVRELRGVEAATAGLVSVEEAAEMLRVGEWEALVVALERQLGESSRKTEALQAALEKAAAESKATKEAAARLTAQLRATEVDAAGLVTLQEARDALGSEALALQLAADTQKLAAAEAELASSRAQVAALLTHVRALEVDAARLMTREEAAAGMADDPRWVDLQRQLVDAQAASTSLQAAMDAATAESKAAKEGQRRLQQLLLASEREAAEMVTLQEAAEQLGVAALQAKVASLESQLASASPALAHVTASLSASRETAALAEAKAQALMAQLRALEASTAWLVSPDEVAATARNDDELATGGRTDAESALHEAEEGLQRTRKKLAEDRKNCFVNMRAYEEEQARYQEALRAAEEEVARARRKLADERKSCFVNMRGLEEGKADAAKEAAERVRGEAEQEWRAKVTALEGALAGAMADAGTHREALASAKASAAKAATAAGALMAQMRALEVASSALMAPEEAEKLLRQVRSMEVEMGGMLTEEEARAAAQDGRWGGALSGDAGSRKEGRVTPLAAKEKGAELAPVTSGAQTTVATQGNLERTAAMEGELRSALGAARREAGESKAKAQELLATVRGLEAEMATMVTRAEVEAEGGRGRAQGQAEASAIQAAAAKSAALEAELSRALASKSALEAAILAERRDAEEARLLANQLLREMRTLEVEAAHARDDAERWDHAASGQRSADENEGEVMGRALASRLEAAQEATQRHVRALQALQAEHVVMEGHVTELLAQVEGMLTDPAALARTGRDDVVGARPLDARPVTDGSGGAGTNVANGKGPSKGVPISLSSPTNPGGSAAPPAPTQGLSKGDPVTRKGLNGSAVPSPLLSSSPSFSSILPPSSPAHGDNATGSGVGGNALGGRMRGGGGSSSAPSSSSSNPGKASADNSNAGTSSADGDSASLATTSAGLRDKLAALSLALASLRRQQQGAADTVAAARGELAAITSALEGERSAFEIERSALERERLRLIAEVRAIEVAAAVEVAAAAESGEPQAEELVALQRQQLALLQQQVTDAHGSAAAVLARLQAQSRVADRLALEEGAARACVEHLMAQVRALEVETAHLAAATEEEDRRRQESSRPDNAAGAQRVTSPAAAKDPASAAGTGSTQAGQAGGEAVLISGIRAELAHAQAASESAASEVARLRLELERAQEQARRERAEMLATVRQLEVEIAHMGDASTAAAISASASAATAAGPAASGSPSGAGSVEAQEAKEGGVPRAGVRPSKPRQTGPGTAAGATSASATEPMVAPPSGGAPARGGLRITVIGGDKGQSVSGGVGKPAGADVVKETASLVQEGADAAAQAVQDGSLINEEADEAVWDESLIEEWDEKEEEELSEEEMRELWAQVGMDIAPGATAPRPSAPSGAAGASSAPGAGEGAGPAAGFTKAPRPGTAAGAETPQGPVPGVVYAAGAVASPKQLQKERHEQDKEHKQHASHVPGARAAVSSSAGTGASKAGSAPSSGSTASKQRNGAEEPPTASAVNKALGSWSRTSTAVDGKFSELLTSVVNLRRSLAKAESTLSDVCGAAVTQDAARQRLASLRGALQMLEGELGGYMAGWERVKPLGTAAALSSLSSSATSSPKLSPAVEQGIATAQAGIAAIMDQSRLILEELREVAIDAGSI